MKKIILFLNIIIVMVMVLGCKTNKLTKVTLSEVTHSIFYAPQYVAITKGYFEEEGLKIDLVNAGGADRVMASLLSKDADIGFSGPEATIYVYNNGQSDYMINFAQLTQKDGSFIVGREKDPSFSLEKLRGKSILGGRLGGVPEMTLEYVIKKQGLTVSRTGFDKDVYVRTDIQFNAMAGSFVNGEGDYSTLFEPTATSLEKAGKVHVLASVGQFSDYIPYTSYYVTKSYMEKNPLIIEKFTKAIYKGQQFVTNSTDQEVATELQKTFNDLSIDELTTIVKRYREADVWCKTPYFSEKGLNTLMDVMEEAKELSKRAPFDKIVNNNFVEKVVKK